MITADGWFDWMDREPGPADKVYSDPCTSEKIVLHDAVGFYAGWMSRLKSTARDAQGRYTPYAAASVTGWFPYKAGIKPVQHFSIFKACWASGSYQLNVRGNAFENESAPIYTLPSGAWAFVGWTVPGDWHNPPPQSQYQVECSARAERDLAEFFSRPLSYWRRPVSTIDLDATEYEHNETTRWGGLYSSCPNGRIRWADIAALRQTQEEDWMAQLSDAAIANMEAFFGKEYTDLDGRKHSSKSEYGTLVQDWFDSEHLSRIFEMLKGTPGRFIRLANAPEIYLLLVSQTTWGTGVRVTRHHIPSEGTFFLLGGRWDSVNQLTPEQMAKIPLGKPLPDLS